MTTLNTNGFKHIIISGPPFERGRSYGQQLRSEIISNLEFYKKWDLFPDWHIATKFVKDNYSEALKKYFPTGLMEMEGIAAGANVSIEDIIILNAKFEMINLSSHLHARNKERHQPAECVAALCLPKATKTGDVILGMNWDNWTNLHDGNHIVILEVHPDPKERIVPFIMLVEVGQLGRIGLNANGLGVLALSLFSSEDSSNNSSRIGYMPTNLLMRMFIESPNFGVGITRILRAERHSSINIIVATGEGDGMNLELTPNQQFICYPSIDKDILTHGNHFISEAFLAKDSIKDLLKMGSSFYKFKRLERKLMDIWKNIDDYSFGNAFTDHLGYPNSLCRHLPDSGQEYNSDYPGIRTVSNVILNLTKKSMRVCKGCPCVGVYFEYKL